MAHFSFSRSSYDECALKQRNEESVAPFKWATDNTVVESKSACYLGTSPFMHNPFKSIPTGSIDIESELRGQTRNLSKCSEEKYNPATAKQYNIPIETECVDQRLVPEYTRINKPCNIFSGISINRFHPLCEDVQELNKIHNNTLIGTNTRLQIKDAYVQTQQPKRLPFDFDKDMKTPCNVQGMPCAYIIPK